MSIITNNRYWKWPAKFSLLYYPFHGYSSNVEYREGKTQTWQVTEWLLWQYPDSGPNTRMGSENIQYFCIILNVTINILYHPYIHNVTTLPRVNSSQSAPRTIYIAYLDSSWISAFHRWRVKAGEERPVTHRVALREDKWLGIAIRQLWIQPPDLSRHDAKKRWAKGIKITRVNCQKTKAETKRIAKEGLFGSPDQHLPRGMFPFLTTHLSTPVHLPWLLRVISHCLNSEWCHTTQHLPATRYFCCVDLLVNNEPLKNIHRATFSEGALWISSRF